MSSSNVLVLIVVAFVAGGCTTALAPAPRLTQGEVSRGCPLGVGGATVVAEDTPDGIALSFTSVDKVVEVRERAGDAAAQHGQGQHLGRGHDGRHAEGGDHGLQMMQMPPARAAAADIDGGSRVGFVPNDPADKTVLRAKLRDRAAAMNALACK